MVEETPWQGLLLWNVGRLGGALEEYQRDWPYILKHGQRLFDGALPAEGSATVGGLCDAFVEAKRHVLESDELSLRSFQEYEESAAGIVAYFGRDRTLTSLGPADFDKFRAKLSVGPKGKRSPVALAKHVRIARMVFKNAEDAGLVEGRVRFGPHFKQPSKRSLRLDRQSRDKRMFEADEIRRTLEAAKPVMRSTILLGINYGKRNPKMRDHGFLIDTCNECKFTVGLTCVGSV